MATTVVMETAAQDAVRAAQAELEMLQLERQQLPAQYQAALAEAHADDMIALRRHALLALPLTVGT